MGFIEKWIDNLFFHAPNQKVKIDKEMGKKRVWTTEYYRLLVMRTKRGKGGSPIFWDRRKAASEASPCIPPSA